MGRSSAADVSAYINGEWIAGDRRQDNINPADGTVIGSSPCLGAIETTAAIDAAAAAYPAWRHTPAPKRADILFKALRLLDQRREELAQALTLEEGKTIADSRGEVNKTFNILEFTAGEGRRLCGETVPSELTNTLAYTVREPLGVVGLITPWNFPVAIPVWKIAPALVSGNTVVFKPATLTPWTAAIITDIFVDAGVPPGVLNMVIGPGSTVGQTIVEDRRVVALSFTGSNDIGQRLYRDVAARGAKAQCEMGGKNPIVVLEDADMELAAVATAQGAFGSTGQRCTATSRAIVVDSPAGDGGFADRFVARLQELAEGLTIGAGIDEQTTMGPSVDAGQMQTVLEYLKIGVQEGATLVTGGSRLSHGAYSKGFFVQPTIFDNVAPTMRIAQEEIFGPVISIIRVKDAEEAIEVANNVEYGLTSSIYSRDINRIFRFLDRIQTGITHVNSPTMGGEAQLPFGGVKATGIGPREMGKTAIEFYTELKTVYVDFTGASRQGKLY